MRGKKKKKSPPRAHQHICVPATLSQLRLQEGSFGRRAWGQKLASARVSFILCRRTHPCSCHLRGRRRGRPPPPGADGESIVMDQRASRPQPWVSECREQRQLFTPPSLFINLGGGILRQRETGDVTLPAMVFASVSQRLIWKFMKCCDWRPGSKTVWLVAAATFGFHKTFAYCERAVVKFHLPTCECDKDASCESFLVFLFFPLLM